MAKVFATRTSRSPLTHKEIRTSGGFFGDSSGPKVAESSGRKRHTFITVREMFSRHTWVYVMRHKSDAVEMFEQFLADSRTYYVPSKVAIVRSDRGG